MINWLDISIVVILGLYIISGFRDGLIKQLVGLFGFVIAFFVALYASKPLGERISEVISSGSSYAGKESIEPIADGLSGLSFFVGMETIIGILSFIVLFILLQVVVGIIASKLKFLNYIPLIGSLNILGGVGVGAIKGFVLVFLLITIISLLPHEYVGDAFENSRLALSLNEILPDIYIKAKSFFLEHYYLVVEESL